MRPYNDRFMAAGADSQDVMDGDDIDGDGYEHVSKKATKPYYECPRCKLETRVIQCFEDEDETRDKERSVL